MTSAIKAPESTVEEPLPLAMLEQVGQNVFRCYQCNKCSSGCPLANRFDLTPNQVMRSVQLNDPLVLESKAIWLCASCQTCTTRCPQQIDVTGVMNALRIEAQQRGIPPAIPEIARFNNLFMGFVRTIGRIPELLLILVYNLREGRPFRDLGMGIRLMRRGRLKPWPHFGRLPKKVTPIAEPKDKVGYFPGCASLSSAAEYDRTARMAAEHLGIELVEPPDWVCCGASSAHATDEKLAHELPLSTLSTIEQMGLDTVTSPCSNCFSRLKAAEHSANQDLGAGHENGGFRGEVRVQHLLDTIMDRVSPEQIAHKVERPLRDLKVACYYGCLITRPSQTTGAEHAEYPVKMDHLIRALGAETVEWSCKTECCGGALSLTQTSVALEMSRKVIEDARGCGAEAIVTMCPLCHMNLDARQRALELDSEIPILHATQLMVLAFGREPKAALLHKNLVDPRPLLETKHLLGGGAR
jgi:heterodisulfide reductase subunit B